jgi:hypothetical protein
VVCKEERLLNGLQQKNEVMFDINIIGEKLFGISVITLQLMQFTGCMVQKNCNRKSLI